MHTLVTALAVALSAAAVLSAQAADGKRTVRVEGGVFAMGSRTALAHAAGPVHRVALSPFHLAVYETTNGDFAAFVAATGYRTSCERDGKGSYVLSDNNDIFVRKPEMTWRRSTFAQGANQPATSVSWIDAINYANWLSARDGLEPAYAIDGDRAVWNRRANGWRLPTEAEWEYAARGGAVSRGFRYAGGDDFYQVAWCSENARQATHPVGGKLPNELGLYDMTGNVYEWCWDWYGPYPEAAPSEAAPTDPAGPADGLFHVLRGGSWNSGPSATTEPIDATFRQFDQAGRAFNTYGFRLARNDG